MTTLALCLAGLLLQAPPAADAPRELRIVAEIDGIDELHIGASEARWVHLAYAQPSFVTLADQPWNPGRDERLVAPEGQPFLPAGVDLAGATVQLVRGRGALDFRHEADGLLLRFDDEAGGGADEYEVLIQFADELCERGVVLGEVGGDAREYPRTLRLEARIDGHDELHLGPWRADWLHLAWGWPSELRLAGRPWDPEAAPLAAAAGGGFFHPDIELERVRMKVLEARGTVELEASGGRLFLSLDDGPHGGAADYVVELQFPRARRSGKPLLPTGPAVRVELTHEPASEVAGAPVSVLARSPRSGEFVRWPGLRGMDVSGRCVLALPAGEYRFEVLHEPDERRLVALRSAIVRVKRGLGVRLPGAARPLVWRDKQDAVEPHEFALHSLVPGEQLVWRRASAAAPGAEPSSAALEPLQLVVSPEAEFSWRAYGAAASGAAAGPADGASAGDAEGAAGGLGPGAHAGRILAWWSSGRFGEQGGLDSSRQRWIRCRIQGRGREPLPPDCELELHGPVSSARFRVESGATLLTNRRFLGLSYRHALEDGGRAVFHQRPVLLPRPGGSHRIELGGALEARGGAAILLDERLGSPETRRLWWQLELVDAAGHVLDTATSELDWKAEAVLRSGEPMPAAPLDEAGLALLGDPVESVLLTASYRWNGAHELRIEPAAPMLFENAAYSSIVPGHLGARARAYLDKARRTYAAIEEARGKVGDHEQPIELKWWLNGGAIGAYGSITMPVDGMSADFDWFSFPWALAHESLHAFGYHHGEELDRIDRAAIAIFERGRQLAERDPDFVPPGW